jgi:VWFA-related protein
VLEILTFDEVTEIPKKAVPATPADIDGGGPKRGKTVLILFDGSNISPGRFKPARDSAEKYVKDHMRPQDLFAVAFYNVSLDMVQSFTRDVDKVLDAIRQLGGSARPPRALTPSRGTPRYARVTTREFSQTLDSLNSELSQVKGRKAILLYSEESIANAIYDYHKGKPVNSARIADVAYYTIDARGLDTLHGTGSAQASASPPKASSDMGGVLPAVARPRNGGRGHL